MHCDAEEESFPFVLCLSFVWLGVAKFAGPDWFIQRCRLATISNSLLKLIIAATIYHHLVERNARISKVKRGDGAVVLDNIRSDIRACLSAWVKVKSIAEWVWIRESGMLDLIKFSARFGC